MNFPATSCFIAPYGTMSSKEDWRKEIKVGDMVDVLDKSKTWYTSTVMYVDTRGEDDDKEKPKMPMIKIGFR